MTAARNLAFPLQMRNAPRPEQRQTRRRGPGDRAPRPVRRSVPPPAVRWPATTHRPCPGDRVPTPAAADGRTAWRARQEAPRSAPARDLRDQPPIGSHRDLRDPRPGRGPGHERSHRDLRRGRIQQLGTGEDLYERPSSVFVADFVGESKCSVGVSSATAMARGCNTGTGVGGSTPSGRGRTIRPPAMAKPAALVVRPEHLRVLALDAPAERREPRGRDRNRGPVSRVDPQDRAHAARRPVRGRSRPAATAGDWRPARPRAARVVGRPRRLSCPIPPSDGFPGATSEPSRRRGRAAGAHPRCRDISRRTPSPARGSPGPRRSLGSLVRDLADVDLAIVGIPFDTGVTYRVGGRFGPNAVRAASVMLRPYNTNWTSTRSRFSASISATWRSCPATSSAATI